MSYSELIIIDTWYNDDSNMNENLKVNISNSREIKLSLNLPYSVAQQAVSDICIELVKQHSDHWMCEQGNFHDVGIPPSNDQEDYSENGDNIVNFKAKEEDFDPFAF